MLTYQVLKVEGTQKTTTLPNDCTVMQMQTNRQYSVWICS